MLDEKYSIYLEKYSIYLILIFAFILRYRGLDFGLPYLYNPDEPSFVNPPINMLVTGDLNPHWFGHPGSFIMYLLLIFFSIFFIYNYSFGHVSNLSDFEQSFTNDPSLYYFSGRLLMIFFAIITIYLVYLIAKNLFNSNTIGILASFLLAISPLHLVHSRLIRTDVTATLLIMFSIYFLLLFFNSQNKNTKFLIFSSLFAGFSIATKYTSGIIIIPILIYCYFIDFKQKYSLRNEKLIKYLLIGFGILLILSRIFMDFSWLKEIGDSYAADGNCSFCMKLINLLLPITGFFLIFIAFLINIIFNIKSNFSKAILFIFIGFFIFAPFVLLDPGNSIKDIINENRGTHLGAERLPGIQNHLWYLSNALQKGIGGLFFEIFAGLGLMIIIIYKKSYEKFLFLIFPMLFFLIVGSMKLRWDRWFIPILPFEAIFFGVGFYYSYKFFIQIQRKLFQKNIPKIITLSTTKISFLLFAILIVFASFQPIIEDINNGTILSKKDTRTIAKDWIEKNLSNGSKIAYEYYAPQLHINPHNNFTLMNVGMIVSKPLSYYKNDSIDYIIITNSFKNRHYDEPNKYFNEISRYEELKNNAELIKIFDNNENPGPIIEIYKLR